MKGRLDGDGIMILSEDGTYEHMAVRINKRYCAGADEDGNYHLIKNDGSLGKRIGVVVDGKKVSISAVVRNNGEIDFIM